MSEGRTRVLMPVFNAIDYDGRVQRAAEALAERYEVRVLSVDSGRGYSHPAFQVRTVSLTSLRGAQPVRHLHFLAALLREAVAWRPQVVHAHDFFMAYPGMLAARLCGARLVYDAHELIVPAPGERLDRRSRIWYGLERRAVQRADLVLAANRQRAELMREHYGLARTPVVVGNIPPPPRRAPGEAGTGRLDPKRPGVVRLVYQGDVALNRGVWEMVRALETLPEHYEMVVAGGGPDLEALRTLVARHGLQGRVTFTGRIPRDELHPLLESCDIGLISYPQSGLNNLWCAPNKLYEYAQAGLPTFARENPVLREELHRWGVGLAGDDIPAGIAAVAAELDRFRSRIPTFLEANRWEVEAARLLEGYQSILGRDEVAAAAGGSGAPADETAPARPRAV